MLGIEAVKWSSQRSHPRVEFFNRVQVLAHNNARPLNLHAGNLSRGGIYVRSNVTLPKGSRIALEIETAHGPLWLRDGEVVWANPFKPDGINRGQNGMGVRFLNMSSEARQQLGILIDNLIKRKQATKNETVSLSAKAALVSNGPARHSQPPPLPGHSPAKRKFSDPNIQTALLLKKRKFDPKKVTRQVPRGLVKTENPPRTKSEDAALVQQASNVTENSPNAPAMGPGRNAFPYLPGDSYPVQVMTSKPVFAELLESTLEQISKEEALPVSKPIELMPSMVEFQNVHRKHFFQRQSLLLLGIFSPIIAAGAFFMVLLILKSFAQPANLHPVDITPNIIPKGALSQLAGLFGANSNVFPTAIQIEKIGNVPPENRAPIKMEPALSSDPKPGPNPLTAGVISASRSVEIPNSQNNQLSFDQTPQGWEMKVPIQDTTTKMKHFTLKNPPRLVIDLPRNIYTGKAKRFSSPIPFVSSLRIAKRARFIRLVIDFRGRRVPDYTMSIHPGELLIAF